MRSFQRRRGVLLLLLALPVVHSLYGYRPATWAFAATLKREALPKAPPPPPTHLPFTSPADADDQESSLHALFKWLASKGFRGDKCGVGVFEDGVRGVVALGRVEAGEAVVELPWEVCLVVRDCDAEAPAYPGVGVNNCVWETLTKEERLAVRLLQERAIGAASRYHDYIKMLPGSFPTHPLLWARHEVQALGYPEVWRGIEEQRAGVDRLVGLMQGHDWATSTAVTWALLCVYSRACNVEMGGRGEAATALALLPGFDLLNHGSSVQHSRLVSCGRRRAFVLEAGQSFDRGTQVLINYGERCNDELLLTYGFVEGSGSNPDDTYHLPPLPLAGLLLQEEEEEEEEEARRADLLGRLGLGQSLSKVRLCRGRVEEGSLMALRLAVASEDEVDASGVRWLANTDALRRPLSFHNEMRVWAVLSEAITTELHRLHNLDNNENDSWRDDQHCCDGDEEEGEEDKRRGQQPALHPSWHHGMSDREGGAISSTSSAARAMQRSLVQRYVAGKRQLLEEVLRNIHRRRESSIDSGGLRA